MGHLTDKDVVKIVKIINNWSDPKLTWPSLVEACKSKLNISRTRQALAAIPAINMAYKDRKAALRNTTQKADWIKDIHQANEKIEALTKTLQQLQMVNQQLLQRFLIWQANADMHGVSLEKLEQPVSSLR
ncbi:hypothetical protein [Microbulbifer hydrolyticus]|uniref:Uncharacterized protein n=1 Tax=Microbulbifer hydrolyticus TaxID=48074 RepID=A0A6P1T5X9_9GAMM|nr:hypothetical protein [Microbulbifer hydrolyticus]MBB5211054.1 hypothetical protein [Microbulbifer hydrolyticus]QHQ38148.1 hypothetical protein GTQ55_03485 [Microbulbifer hydrolyticus]